MSMTCPVCGWDRLPFDWNDRAQEICSCCGTQFGCDDIPADSTLWIRRVTPTGNVGRERKEPSKSSQQSQQVVWASLRQKWIDGGMVWWDDSPPEGWNPQEQLRRLRAGTPRAAGADERPEEGPQ